MLEEPALRAHASKRMASGLGKKLDIIVYGRLRVSMYRNGNRVASAWLES